MEPIVITKQLTIGSLSFAHKELIPSKFTCDGQDINPSLTIEGIPNSAKSLAIVLEDPDAAQEVFIHWIVWNIPVQEIIFENSTPGIVGKNSYGTERYQGPCPPKGKSHHYSFKVFALDTMLELKAGADIEMLEDELDSHAIAEGEIIGMYKKISHL